MSLVCFLLVLKYSLVKIRHFYSILTVQPSSSDRGEMSSNRTLTKSSEVNGKQSSSRITADSKMDVSTSKLGDLLEAMYDCEAERSDELTFRQGELIQLAARPDDDWWVSLIAITVFVRCLQYRTVKVRKPRSKRFIFWPFSSSLCLTV